MIIILTHLGSDIPPYTKESLRQFRLFNPAARVFFIAQQQFLKRNSGLLKTNGVEPVAAETLNADAGIKAFEKSHWFKNEGIMDTIYPSPPHFWQYTIERLFFIDCFMRRNRLQDVFHFENDVLLYANLDSILSGIRAAGRKGIFITPVGDQWLSCGLLFADRAEPLTHFCDFVLEQTLKTQEAVCAEFKIEALNDMTLLKAFGDRSEALNYFPVLPEGTYARHFPEFDSVFDGASWGQFVGGTNNGHPAGWAGGHHYVGAELLSGNYHVDWQEENGLNIPFAVHREGRRTRINNLHIHSKKLDRFVSKPDSLSSQTTGAGKSIFSKWF